MKSVFSATMLLMVLPLSSLGEEHGLDFLSKIPEFRDFSLMMSEDQLKTQIDKHQLYSEKETQEERVTYWLLTAAGENVTVGFASGKCTGIQRMQPIPKQVIKEAIGESEYRAWMAKRKADPEGGANGSQPSRSGTNSTSSAADSRRSP